MNATRAIGLVPNAAVQRAARWAMLLGAAAMLSAALSLPLEAQSGGPAASVSSAPSDYVGWEVCQGCHIAQVTAWKETKMGKVMLGKPRNDLEAKACEACHGGAREHVAAKGDTTKIFRFTKASPATVAEKNERCLQCHQKGAQAQWDGSMHESRNIACVQCHTIMKSVSPELALAKTNVVDVCAQCHVQRKAQTLLSSHMPVREGKVTCVSCHNPHGSTGPKLLVQNSVNEVCYTCHAERRGPFLWEHPPVTENCINCHEPHGSINDNLLKVRAPRLCQQCHIDVQHPGTPQTATARFAFNRSCTNCHSQLHGSNHPSGARFHR